MQTKIIASYKKISGFIFHYLVFFVALVLAVILFQNVILKSSTLHVFQANDKLLMQKTRLISEFNKFLKQNINDNDLEIKILQWDLQTEAGFIKSVNNLVTYKGFVVPRYFYMYTTIPVKALSYFSGGTYDISELENFLNIFVFTKKITVSKWFTRVQLPLSSTIIDDFNLSCIFENKFSKSTCNYYLNDFLDDFFVYTISADYSWLKKVFDAIKNDPQHKQLMCEWLSKYLLYANDQSDPVKQLFSLCGQSYEELFKRTTLFMEIQKTVENQSFEKTTYKDLLLNEYKLLSYQQQIYQDFLINKADTYKISTYLDFVEELLKKNAIDPFYKDEIYRYNNKYLSLSLEKLAYQSNIFTQNLGGSKIASLLTAINALNEWAPMLGFPGLAAWITNTGLITTKDIYTWAAISITDTEAEKIQKRLKNLSYLTIEKQEISDTDIDIIGYLKFFSPDGNETIKSHIIMQYKNDLLLVKSINLQNKAEMNDVLKNLLRIQDFSIGELYSYISKNLVFYGQENAPVSANTDLCPTLQEIKNATLTSCSNTKVAIKKDNLTYEFTIKNWWVEDITLSDKILENAIKTSYSTIVWTNYTLVDIIQALLAYEAPEQWHEGTTNAIVVFEKIQQYLSIKPNDIADNNGTILVDISLGWINFIVKYTLSNTTLWPWYFKDILANGKPYLIQNLSLPLDDAHKNSINSFVIDPLIAIKNADLTAWQNYRASQINN